METAVSDYTGGSDTPPEYTKEQKLVGNDSGHALLISTSGLQDRASAKSTNNPGLIEGLHGLERYTD